ncbi:MAG: OadG family protein [Spirochaetota bacterium]
MNIEKYVFSLITTILGMGIVFLFLALLSLMMNGLKRLFIEKQPVEAPAETPAAEPKKDNRKNLKWVIIAVSTFIALEEAEVFHYSAAMWTAAAGKDNNFWVLRGRTPARRIGV